MFTLSQFKKAVNEVFSDEQLINYLSSLKNALQEETIWDRIKQEENVLTITYENNEKTPELTFLSGVSEHIKQVLKLKEEKEKEKGDEHTITLSFENSNEAEAAYLFIREQTQRALRGDAKDTDEAESIPKDDEKGAVSKKRPFRYWRDKLIKPSYLGKNITDLSVISTASLANVFLAGTEPWITAAITCSALGFSYASEWGHFGKHRLALREATEALQTEGTFPKQLQWVTSRWVTYDMQALALVLGFLALLAFGILTGLDIATVAATVLVIAATAVPALVRKANVGIVAYAAEKAQSACQQAHIPFDETTRLLSKKEKELELTFNEKKKQHEQELNSIRRKQDTLNENIKRLRKRNKRLSKKNEELESTLSEEKEQHEQELNSARREQEALNEKIGHLEKQNRKLKESFPLVKRDEEATNLTNKGTPILSSPSARFFHASPSATQTESLPTTPKGLIEVQQTERQEVDKEKKGQDHADNSPLPILSGEEHPHRTGEPAPSPTIPGPTPPAGGLAQNLTEQNTSVFSLKKGK